MELIADPIVCQREADIPPAVKRLRTYVQHYMIRQRVWVVLLILALVLLFILYTPGVLLAFSIASPSIGRLLDILPSGLMACIIIPPAFGMVFGRMFGPNWVEQYYKHRLVLIEIEPSSKPLGRFTYGEVHKVLKELSNQMGFVVDPGLFLYDKHKTEANAFYTSIVDHHTKTEKIVLHRNVLFILNEDELRAVLAHELGHMIQPWPLVFRSKIYGRTCELLADYNALVHAGLLPTVNALIKIYARKDYLSALWEIAQEALLENGFQIESVDELAAKADAHVRHTQLGEQEGESEAARLVRRLLRRSQPNPLSRWQRIKQGINLQKVRQLRNWRKRWKAHLPTAFTQFYSNQHIDEREFRALVEQLAKKEQSDLFVPLPPKEQKKASHPPLRDRLLFLARCANVIDERGIVQPISEPAQ